MADEIARIDRVRSAPQRPEAPHAPVTPPPKTAPSDGVDAPRSASATRLGKTFDTAYWETLTKLARRSPSYASSLEGLVDGGRAWQARIELIERARSSIVNTVYLIEPDDYSVAYLEALTAAQKRGVKVTLAIDFVAHRTWSGFYSSEEQGRLTSKLAAFEQAGGTLAWYAPPVDQLASVGRGMHFKALIADGQEAITGGRNIGKSYFEDWGDYDVHLRGTAVGALASETISVMRRADPTVGHALSEHGDERRAYGARLDDHMLEAKREWQRQKDRDLVRLQHGESLGTKLLLVVSDPTHEGNALERDPNRLTQALLETFKRARREILVTSNFVNACDPLRLELIAAAKRGVRVRVVTGGPESNSVSDLPYVNAQARYAELQAAGIEIYEAKRLEHAKIYAVDGELAAFGSYNLEHPADTLLVEGLSFTEDAVQVSAIRERILEVIDVECKRYTAPPPEPTTFFGKVSAWFKRLVAWFLEPLV